MPSTQESGSQPRRPGFGRHPSSSSYISQSPSDGNGHSASYKAPGQRPQKHVVGKVGRNVSFGKNLHKLSTQANAQDGDGTEGRNHKRNNSGESAPSSPRPQAHMKRNPSSVYVKRNTSQTTLRKNLSSGHLPRQGSSRNVTKGAKAEAPQMKRAHSTNSNAIKSEQQTSPPPKPSQPTVRFDFGAEQAQDDGWTEDSASQSPETTRTNTRSNSIAPEPVQTFDGTRESTASHRRQSSDSQVRFAQPSTSPPPSAQRHSLSNSPGSERHRSSENHQVNGSSSYHSPPRPPDADAITSRLLQRAPSHNAAAPQTSTVSATVRADADGSRSLSQSQGSTLNETPGKDLVSRFINGSGSSGNTPRDSSFLPRMKDHAQVSDDEEIDSDNAPPKRNKSAPNMAHPLSAASAVASSSSHNRASSQTHMPPSAFVNPEMHPSRTQQKLWLQRASSAIEPQKNVPATLPRSGGPPLLKSGVDFPSTVDSKGKLDPRLQRVFEQVNLEYKAIRRYRNPLAEAVRKLEHVDGVRKAWLQTGASSTIAGSSAAPSVNGTRTPVQSSRASTAGASSRGAGGERDRAEVGSRRSRVSFDVSNPREAQDEEDDVEVDGSSVRSAGETTIGSQRDDAYEICRRLWDMPATGDGG